MTTNYHEIQILKHEQQKIFERLNTLSDIAHDHKHYVEKPLKDNPIQSNQELKEMIDELYHTINQIENRQAQTDQALQQLKSQMLLFTTASALPTGTATANKCNKRSTKKTKTHAGENIK